LIARCPLNISTHALCIEQRVAEFAADVQVFLETREDACATQFEIHRRKKEFPFSVHDSSASISADAAARSLSQLQAGHTANIFQE